MALTRAESESQSIAGASDIPWRSLTGETDIDDSAQTESTPYSIMTIAPATDSPILECFVDIDLAKATTGFAAVESSATILFQVARQVDGTNWRRGSAVEAALSGTNAAGRSQRINVGPINSGEAAQIFITMSADATSDMELLYEVHYRAKQAPTLTVVAA